MPDQSRSSQGGRILAGDVVRELRVKLEDMELHDETEHPFDDGYMQAVDDIREWMREQGWL